MKNGLIVFVTYILILGTVLFTDYTVKYVSNITGLGQVALFNIIFGAIFCVWAWREKWFFYKTDAFDALKIVTTIGGATITLFFTLIVWQEYLKATVEGFLRETFNQNWLYLLLIPFTIGYIIYFTRTKK